MNRPMKQQNGVQQILDLLAHKHADDIYTEEIQQGEWPGRLDAVAIKKSWARPCITGYEVKVSRNDFLNDEKWRYYLDSVNKLYFVCPPGLIEKSELPSDVGLMYTTKTGTRVYRKQNAPWSDTNQDAEAQLYKAILMRSHISRRSSDKPTDSSRDYWEEWLRDKRNKHVLGLSVSRELRRRLEEKVIQVENENGRLISENQRLGEIKQFCEENNMLLYFHRSLGYCALCCNWGV